jgi:hypothetical protein
LGDSFGRGSDDTIVIDAPYFYAAVVCAHGRVVRFAPILKYMKDWSDEKVIEYARSRGWGVTVCPR